MSITLGAETMIALEYEMTYSETIEGPLGPTAGSPVGERLCWQVTPRRCGPAYHRQRADAGN